MASARARAGFVCSAIQAALDALKKDVAAGRQDAERMHQAAESARGGAMAP